MTTRLLAILLLCAVGACAHPETVEVGSEGEAALQAASQGEAQPGRRFPTQERSRRRERFFERLERDVVQLPQVSKLASLQERVIELESANSRQARGELDKARRELREQRTEALKSLTPQERAAMRRFRLDILDVAQGAK